MGEALLASLPQVPTYRAPRDTTVHRVRRGETLSEIAGRYRTSVRALMRLNRLRSANRIWPGQQLRVPDRGPAVHTSDVRTTEGTVRHRVRPGDSLWQLAQRYGTTVAQIREDNDLRGSLLHPGQTLVIRGGAGGSSATGRP